MRGEGNARCCGCRAVPVAKARAIRLPTSAARCARSSFRCAVAGGASESCNAGIGLPSAPRRHGPSSAPSARRVAQRVAINSAHARRRNTRCSWPGEAVAVVACPSASRPTAPFSRADQRHRGRFPDLRANRNSALPRSRRLAAARLAYAEQRFQRILMIRIGGGHGANEARCKAEEPRVPRSVPEPPGRRRSPRQTRFDARPPCSRGMGPAAAGVVSGAVAPSGAFARCHPHRSESQIL